MNRSGTGKAYTRQQLWLSSEEPQRSKRVSKFCPSTPTQKHPCKPRIWGNREIPPEKTRKRDLHADNRIWEKDTPQSCEPLPNAYPISRSWSELPMKVLRPNTSLDAVALTSRFPKKCEPALIPVRHVVVLNTRVLDGLQKWIVHVGINQEWDGGHSRRTAQGHK